VYNKLEEKGFVTTIKSAKTLVEKEKSEVWDILAEVIREHPVLLNRAPTLHRLGIQAFEPVLVEGKAIKIHPLVCTAFNADFDGDQMAVHVPLSVEAQMEARVLMMSTNNLLSPAYGKPIINPSQDIVLGLYYTTRPREFARGEGKLFASQNDVRAAYDNGVVALQAKVKCRINNKIYDTTVGRVLLYEIVPPEIPFDVMNKTLGKKEIGALIDRVYRDAGSKATVLLADSLRTWGYEQSTHSGASISIEDLIIPDAKKKLLDKATGEVKEVENSYREGLITDGERLNKVIDIWAAAAEQIADEMMKGIKTEKVKSPEGKESREQPSFNSIFMMADSGARGSPQQIRQLAGMRGLMAKPSGEIIETPITANFREGLTVLQYFISTHGARKGLADTALKTANSGYLTRRLVDVANDAVVMQHDCGTLDGVEVESILEGGEVIEQLGERILGRVALEDVLDPISGEVLVHANDELNENRVEIIENAGLQRVKIRSTLTCQTRAGICVLCYGRDLARGKMVNIGEAVGVIAAQSIGEPGTQLTMRTFHVGGAARARQEQSTLEVRNDGRLQFKNLSTVQRNDGTHVVMNRTGEIIVVDDSGREKERYPATYGARLSAKDGDRVAKGQTIAEWDPFANPILTEYAGIARYVDVEENVTVREELDEVTGLSRKVIIESKSDLRPAIEIRGEDGKALKDGKKGQGVSYMLPVNANIVVLNGAVVAAGDILAKIPRETTKTKDITGGLPRVAELFEARKPKEVAQISEIDGFVSFGKDTKGKRKLIVTPEVGDPTEYLIPKGKHISVHEGDYVHAGDLLMDGSANPHDILRVKGEKELAKYLVNEIQQVYRLQGVKINDKHIEIIVRQMLRWVRILEVGDTNFLVNEQVERWRFEAENTAVLARGGEPGTAEPIMLGITKASLSTDSFLSASSFQETTKVLTEAAISGKIDPLAGLKENVVMGRLIPAGTGVSVYDRMGITLRPDAEVPDFVKPRAGA
ncbi:MAG: DNA-directed RNA polymerase subunit beta', partial [Trueperaceae bacterium]|nr:DNA-directed RNA polymerase subunit beta' [Trueperaceae bacterium]